MTWNFAMEYIPRRMKELGYGMDYHLRIKHFTFGPVETRTFDAYSNIVILVDPSYNMRIESDMGVHDWTDSNLREFQYEHTGLITMKNKWEGINNAQFIQVIPKQNDHAGNQR